MGCDGEENMLICPLTDISDSSLTQFVFIPQLRLRLSYDNI